MREGFGGHMQQLKVLICLKEFNAQARTEENFLVPAHFDHSGHHLVPRSVKHQESKIRAVLNVAQPKTLKQSCRFLEFYQ